MPAVLRLEIDHRELSGDELHLAAARPERNLDEPVVDLSHRIDLVVVQREKEACDEFAIDVEAEPDGSDRDIRPAQERRMVKRRSVEYSVEEPGSDEKPGRAMQHSPPLVASEDLVNRAR